MVENIIAEIEAISVDNYKTGFPELKEKALKALALLPNTHRYFRERQAMESIVWIISHTEVLRKECPDSWLCHVFKNKKQYALEALNICLRKQNELAYT